jgi:NADPH-dependent 2,4-dienoyl-CoA reductase/sulfur reductase-like enzyme
LLIHAGVVPNVQLSRAIGLAHIWDQGGLAWRPETDDMGRTEIDGIVIAGDGAGIAGADAAVSSGQLAALAALGGLAEIAEIEIARTKDALALHRKNRPVLDALFAPRAEFLRPADDTIVCRCESVTAGQVRQLVEQGCGDPNAVKSISRAGMGPCQGRYCGLTVSQLVAEMRDISPAEAGYFRLRAPATPVTLAELAGLELPEDGDGGS